MAATSLRYEGVANHSWVAVAGAMLALALGSGYALALHEMAGLYVALSLICGVAVLLDFRAGAVLLLLMLPTAASSLFPQKLMQITGLSPLNLLVLATLGSYVIHGRLQAAGALVPKPLVWLYIVPIVAAGLIGMGHVDEIPAFFINETGTIAFPTETRYLLEMVFKPMVMVGVALLVGAAAARSQKPERFIIPLALSVWLVGLIQIGFVIAEGPSLATLALAEERRFYSPIGISANSLGRLHLSAFALLLFVWAQTKRPGMRLFMLLTLGLLGAALLLTFSRAAIGGAIVVGALFLMWKFNLKTLSLSIIAVVLAGFLGAEALYSRLTLGFDEGANAVSAGRIEGIWLPLLPELAKSPLWGNGLSSILWSFPMVNEAMTRTGHPHSAYLEALLDMGIIGLVLLLAYYVHVWKGFRTLAGDAWLNSELRGLFQGAIAALIAFFVTCVVGSTLRPDTESAAYLWIAIGLMYGLRGRRPAR
jgi:O-antigen ligase